MADCHRCGQYKDPQIVEINGEEYVYCSDCRKSLFSRKNPIGRPGIGITKKVSLTLEEDDWNQFDELAEDNKSNFLRQLVIKEIDKKNRQSEYYFKSERHEKNYYSLVKMVLTESDYVGQDQNAFLYLITALDTKFEDMLDCFEDGYFNTEKMQEKIERYSSTERNMIRFAIHMLPRSGEDITLSEAMSNLDERNHKVMFQAINIRYRW